jgi:quinoprotein glucose dehydrogenase
MAKPIALYASLILSTAAFAQQPYTTWSDYAGSADASQYSELKQVDRSNVGKLELAWFYPTPGPGSAFNPLVVDGVIYALGSQRAIVALDAATGKQLWSHPVEGSPAERGINYWESRDRADRRLIFTAGSFLQEINARTGVTINTFGKDGRIDLREGLGRDPKSIRNIQSKNPGRVFENFIILGSVTGEGFGSPPGDIRAYDVRTGAMAWTFHTIPRPGEFGYESWPPEAYKYAGGANVWGEMAIDEKRGILYAPTGSPTFDLYGADRKGANLFGNSLLALDARTGKRLWHFQTVHHDLWDYDLTASPKLLTVRRNGRPVDIVAQAGKSGFLYVFDRVTGQPMWPIEERPMPKSEVPGEESWPTQPIPTAPPAFSRQKFSVDDINPHLDAEERERLKQTLLKAANQGVFTPSSHLRNHIQIPGAFGGANWGALAVEPAAGLLYIRSYDAPSIRTLTERRAPVRLPANATTEQRGFAAYMQNCSACHGPERDGIPAWENLGDARLTATVRNGRGEMPSFEPEAVSDANLKLIAAYLKNPAAGVIPSDAVQAPAAGGRGGRGGDVAPGPPRPEGLRNFSGPFGGQWLSKSGLPAIGPPWSELVGYDLNAGTIKWRVPAGEVPSLAEKGIRNTGSYRPRGGPVVTAGGLIFMGTGSDHALRAYDKDNGKVLWEKVLDANPDGIPAIYEMGGRQYVVFYAAGDAGGGSRTPANFKPGKPEAQGYYAFALRERGN